MPDDVRIVQYEGERPGLIVVGVPTFGAVSIQWHGHMMQLQTPLNRALRHLYVQGKEVGDARNEIVEHALALVGPLGERVSHVLFIDDDVLLPPDAVARLLAHKLPIIAGLYYAKTIAPQPLVLADRFGGVRTDWTPGDLVECYAHGMGCTLIAREVFEAVERPWFQTTRQHDERAGVPISYHQTEDVWFLERAKAAGYTPTVDTGLLCWHWSMAERVAYPIQAWQKQTQEPAA
jgi:hypothetical protein